MNMDMDVFVSNAEKSYNLLQGIFTKATKAALTSSKAEQPVKNQITKNLNSNMIVHSSPSNIKLNFDLDDDDFHLSSPKISPKAKGFTLQYKENEEDIWQIAHRVIPKRSMIDIETYDYVEYYKLKKVETIVSFFSKKEKPEYKQIPYLTFFDEQFIYMVNMTKKENNKYDSIKKVGKHYDLKRIKGIDINDDIEEGRKCISISLSTSSERTKTKILHFEYENAIKFFNMLKYYLRKFKIPLYYEDIDFLSDSKGELLSNCSISTSALS